MIAYRPYVGADHDAVLALLTEGMPAAHAAAKRAMFHWQFFENPHADGHSPFLVAVADDAIVGINAMMPVRIVYHGRRRMAGWSCDSRVDDRFRGRGIVPELVRRLQSDIGILMGYGITDSMMRALDKVPWETSPDLTGFFFYANERGAKGLMKNLHSRISRRMRQAARRDDIRISVNQDVDFGNDVDDLWTRSAPTYVSAVERDAAYLNWKYRRHPLLSYCWYAALRDGQLSGVLVARPDASTSVIADYCGPRGDAVLLNQLLHTAVDDLSARGTARIRCETTDPDVASALQQNGFRQSVGVYRFRCGCSDGSSPHPLRGFFLMTGDSDNDLTAVLRAAD